MAWSTAQPESRCGSMYAIGGVFCALSFSIFGCQIALSPDTQRTFGTRILYQHKDKISAPAHVTMKISESWTPFCESIEISSIFLSPVILFGWNSVWKDQVLFV